MHFARALSAFLSISLAGCAGTVGQPDAVKTKLEAKFLNRNIEEVVAQIGPPQSKFDLSPEKTSYTWTKQTHKYSENVLVKSDERCSITMIFRKNDGTVLQVGNVDDSLGGWNLSYCAEQFDL